MWAPRTAAPAESAPWHASTKSIASAMGREMSVGRKAVTPVLGSCREISSIAVRPDAASLPANPFTCRSMKPGTMMSPASIEEFSASGSTTPSETMSIMLSTTRTVASGRSRSGVSTRPRSKNRLISGTIGAMSHHLGLDVGGTNLKWAVVERDGESRLVKSGRLPTDTHGGEKSVVGQLLDVARVVTGAVEGIESVGIGMPGVLDPDAGVTRFIPNIPGNWDGVEEAAAAALAGDLRARRGFQEAGRYLGIGASNVVVLVGVERIVIGGGVASAGELLLEPMRQEIQRRVHVTDVARIKVVCGELGIWAGAIGAALHGAAEEF